MLRIVQNISAGGAKTYYSSADYYTEGQELQGVWRGQGAARLGLSGAVQKEAWESLCDNRDPKTGLPLTVRHKQERSVGYDFNFHVPKSVSLLYELTRDRAHSDCVPRIGKRYDGGDGNGDEDACPQGRPKRGPHQRQHGVGRIHPLHVAAGGRRA